MLLGELKTRVLAIVSANYQCTIYELEPLLSRTRRPEIYHVLRYLIRMGIIAQAKLGDARSYFLNPKHPSYKGFRAFGKAARRRWPIPINNLPQIPRAILRDCLPPSNPPCNLFGEETSTRALLFIAAAGSANSVQLLDMLGRSSIKDSQTTLNSLVRRGLVTRPSAGWERPAVINRKMFAYDAVMLILKGLLKVHPEIKVLVAKMRKYRRHRWYLVNRGRPHIKGPPRFLRR